jgi:integrase
MARRNEIDTLAKRKKLAPRNEPYWHKIKTGQHLGYRKTRSGGTWQARLTVEGTKTYHTESLHDDMDFDEAVDAAQAWFKSVAGASDHRYRVSDAVDDYVEHLKVHNSETSATDTRQRLDNHLPDSIKSKEVAALKTATIRQWHLSLVRQSDDPEDVRKSKDGANKLLGKLKAALNLAFQSGIIASDTEWRRVKPFKGASGARILFLTDTQVQNIIDAAEGAFRDLLTAARLTGARYGELAGITVADLDKAGGRLRLDGKTGERWCYLSDDALAWFKKQARDKTPKAWLLPRDAGKPWKKSEQVRPMKAAVMQAKAPKETVFYSLRHYHISKALQAGVPAQVIAENCGTSVRMIEKHYGHFLKTDRRAFMNGVAL